MTTTVCAACRGPMSPGEALRVTVLQTGEAFDLHRPGLDSRCFGYAGTADSTRIELFDPAAARRLDAAIAATFRSEPAYG